MANFTKTENGPQTNNHRQTSGLASRDKVSFVRFENISKRKIALVWSGLDFKLLFKIVKGYFHFFLRFKGGWRPSAEPWIIHIQCLHGVFHIMYYYHLMNVIIIWCSFPLTNTLSNTIFFNLGYMNSSLNPCIYAIMNPVMRKAMLNVLNLETFRQKMWLMKLFCVFAFLSFMRKNYIHLLCFVTLISWNW